MGRKDAGRLTSSFTRRLRRVLSAFQSSATSPKVCTSATAPSPAPVSRLPSPVSRLPSPVSRLISFFPSFFSPFFRGGRSERGAPNARAQAAVREPALLAVAGGVARPGPRAEAEQPAPRGLQGPLRAEKGPLSLPARARPSFLPSLRSLFSESAPPPYSSGAGCFFSPLISQAHDSMAAYSLPLATGLEAKRLDGIGDAIANRLQAQLLRHCRENNLPPPENPRSQSGTDGASQQSQPRRPAKRKSPAHGEGEAGEEGPPRKTRKSKAAAAAAADAAAEGSRAKTKAAAYVPRYRSGPYAILLALLEAGENGPEPGLGTKADIIRAAQPLCDSSFDTPEPGKFYTAWRGMSDLLKKELVYKSGSSYCLTEDGRELAVKMRRAVAAEQGADAAEGPPQPAGGAPRRGSGAPGASRAAARSTPSELRFAERAPFQFWYLSADDRRVRRARDAHAVADVRQQTFGSHADLERTGKDDEALLYKIEYHRLQAHHSFASLLFPTGQTSPDGNVVAHIREQHAPDYCPGIDVRSLLSGELGAGPDTEPGPQGAHCLPPPLVNSSSSMPTWAVPAGSSSQPLPRSFSREAPTASTSASASQPLPPALEPLQIVKSSSNPLPLPPSAVPPPAARSASAPDPSPPVSPAFDPVILPAGSFEVLCLIDTREVRRLTDRDYFHVELRRMGIPCEQQVLEVGDVTWIARRAETGEEVALDFILERKRLD
ncbi:MAG: hypothetical protein BJ554DRAFT_330, partial [Olpidium bornovanus]